jgi:ABC-type branched-subunit amino acid transport system ATPase component
MTSPVLLEAVGVSRSFAGVRALSDVDWVVRAGEIWGIVGPNGSGKTTLFNCMSGYMRPSSGRVRFDGNDVTRAPMRVRARRGLMRTFQHAEVFGTLTVGENLRVAARARRQQEQSLIGLLETVGLASVADVPASMLSFGKRRQLGIAVAAATNPSLLLLDEPTSGLNDSEASELFEYLLTLHARGLTLAIVDHHMEFLLPLCHQMLLLRSGEKLWQGTPTDFVANTDVIDSYLGAGTQYVNTSNAASLCQP